MLIPILVSAVGFFVTGIFAFSFSDIAVIPAPVQSWMVIFGSALIIFGAELNTPFTTIEVFRKILRKESNSWDISALIASLIGTMVNLLVTFASRLSLDPAWRAVLLNWGPLLAGLAVACDYYGAMVELGFLFGSFETRMERWLEEKREHEQEHGPSVDASWPTARIENWREMTEDLNGRTPKTYRGVIRLCHDNQLLEPSKNTVARWLRMVETDDA